MRNSVPEEILSFSRAFSTSKLYQMGITKHWASKRGRKYLQGKVERKHQFNPTCSTILKKKLNYIVFLFHRLLVSHGPNQSSFGLDCVLGELIVTSTSTVFSGVFSLAVPVHRSSNKKISSIDWKTTIIYETRLVVI